MKSLTEKLTGLFLAVVLLAAGSSAMAQRAQGCADENGRPVACEGDGIESADGTGMESADGTGIESADGTGVESDEEPVEDDG